jgi:crotonobetainyl-CoA:carnitine CoA-transferase CaiB-like acyl-CoA transferase
LRGGFASADTAGPSTHLEEATLSEGPLRGIRIVDLSIALSGPWGVGILADQGAYVV